MNSNKGIFSTLVVVIIALFYSTCIYCQYQPGGGYDYMKLSGPRLGITIITGEGAQILKDDFDASPIVTQFGWQFETRFFTLEDGTTGLVEGVVLVGGFEQGLFLPSVSGLIGLRSGKGAEFGIGPNLSITGAALVFAAGFTMSSEGINFPINFAVLPSPKGVRFTILVGFNAKSYR